jgi:protein MBA1
MPLNRTPNFRPLCSHIANVSPRATATMSSNLPLRTIRIPALRQQCLFQRRRSLQSPRAFSTTSPQAFASTSPRLRKGNSLGEDKNVTRVAMKSQIGPAPKVNEIKAQQEGAMAEDIGVLQDTIIRAGWSKLPMVWNSKFWSYMWKLLKSKGTGMYS